MLKILIINNDFKYSRSILNLIINRFNNLQLYMATTYEEGIDIISSNNIDLVFIQLELPKCKSEKILEKIQYMNILKKPQIINIYNDIQIARQKEQFSGKIDELKSFNIIYDKIKDTVNKFNYLEREKDIKEFILSELLNMGYNIKYRGTQYIYETICYIYETNNFYLIDNLEQNVYKYIGNKHNKTMNNIKTSIITATSKIEKIYFSNLTPKSTIVTILTKINQKLYIL